MPDLRTALREYLKISDAALLEGLRDGSISVEEAKRDTAEMEKWREQLAVLEAADILHGGAPPQRP